jgi:hypothetical protein
MKKILIILGVVALLITGYIFLSDEEETPVTEEPVVENPIEEDPVEEDVEPIKKVEIFANESGQYGVEMSTTFTMKSPNPITLDEVKEHLVVTPETDFEVTTIDEYSVLITPSVKLLSNTIYSFNYDALDYGKAFQTVDDIKIFSSFPGNGSYDVPTRTGIELLFNINDVTDLEDYFEIEPSISGKFEYKDNQVVFMPEELEAGSTYKVTIKPGLLIGSREMTEEYSFTFTTGYGDNYNWNIAYHVMNVAPGESTFIPLNTWSYHETHNVKIYQAKDFETYKTTYTKFLKNSNQVDLGAYELVFDEELATTEYNYGYFIELMGLEKGRYIVLTESKDLEQYTFMQVDDHQMYYSHMTNGDLFWVMDTVTDQPVEGAEIREEDVLYGQTLEDGTLFVTTPYDTAYRLYTVHIEDNAYILKSKPEMSYYYFDDYHFYQQSNYWSYLYTDRRVYQENDTVSVEGYVKHHDGEPVGSLTLQIGNYWNDDKLIEVQVELDEHNHFNAEIQLEGLEYGYYGLRLLNGDDLVRTSEISIYNYEKPEIKLESSLDKDIVFNGEPVKYTLKASYFNELPYEDFKVNVAVENSGDNLYTTNEEGVVEVEFNANVSVTDWHPVRFDVWANNAGIEDTYLFTQDSLMVLPRDIMIESEGLNENNLATVNVSSHTMTLEGYGGNYYDYESLRDQPYDTEITAVITDTYYEKIFIRTEYDPIHKVSYDIYEYNRKEVQLDPITVTTVDGQATFTFATEDEHYYSIKYETLDQQGRITHGPGYVGSNFYKWFDYTVMYQYDSYEGDYLVGETVTKEILKYGEKFDSEEDQVLHLTLRNGLLEHVLEDDSVYSFTFKDEFRPNVLLKSIYYDGARMHVLPKYSSLMIPYAYESQEGSITVEFDQEDYAPGSNLIASIQVTDNKGQPFNGVLNVSVVDEAYFALFEDYFNLGSTLHAFTYNDGIIYEAVTADDEAMASMAEAGEGGDGDFIRDSFKDTAYFSTIAIENGQGVFEFELPDNLTSWRFTLHAVNDNLDYAAKKSNVNVSLPFFIRALHNNEYIKGDEVYVSLRADGEEYTNGGEITYTSQLTLDQTAVESSITVKTNEIVNLYLGKMTGSGTGVLTGTFGELKDGIKEDYRVEETYLKFKHYKDSAITAAYQLENNNDSSIVYIYNQAARDYQEDLFDSFVYSNERLEEILARFAAYDLMQEAFEGYEYEYFDLDHFQNYDGGLKLLSTSDSHVITTSLVAVTKFGMKYFDKESMINYLNAQLMHDSLPLDTKAMVLYALASLEEPVLIGVDALLEMHPYETLTPKSQLYVTLALNEMNDKTRVFTYGQDLLSRANDLSVGDQYLLAAHALDIGLEYELNKDYKSDSIGLQRVYYMSKKPLDFNDASVTLKVGEQTETLTVSGLNSIKRVIDEGVGFEIINHDEAIRISEIFHVDGTMYNKYTSNQVSIKKEYDKTTVKQGDVVKVTLTFDKPTDKWARIMDRIPAGFEYAGPVNRNIYSIWNENQEIYSSVWKNDLTQIAYYMKAVQVGTYNVDPAAIQMFYDGELDMTEPVVLEVTE